MALAAGRTIAMQEASTNKPQGPRYRKAIGNWLRIWGFDRIDKGDRTRLLEIAGNLMTINAWRDGLPPEQRFRFNSPTTVLRAWRRANDPIGGGTGVPVQLKRPLSRLKRRFGDFRLPIKARFSRKSSHALINCRQNSLPNSRPDSLTSINPPGKRSPAKRLRR